MKRIISLALIAVLCVSMFAMTAFAASSSATLTGPGTVRAGDTITLTFNVNGSGIFGASGTLNYDSKQLTLSSTSQKIGNGWKVEFNGNNFLAIDENLAKPINSNTALFTVTFKVNSNLAVGTAIKVSYTNITTTDGNADTNVSNATYSKTIAAPMSKDNALKSLTVSNATISPAFSAGTTSYTAEVPFEVSKLDVKATANDSKAKVSVNSPNLTPGGTTKVTITVTAENGDKKTYTVIVKRAAAHDGSVEELPDEPSTDEPDDTQSDTDATPKTEGGIAWWWLLIVGVGALAIGVVGGFFGKDLLLRK